EPDRRPAVRAPAARQDRSRRRGPDRRRGRGRAEVHAGEASEEGAGGGGADEALTQDLSLSHPARRRESRAGVVWLLIMWSSAPRLMPRSTSSFSFQLDRMTTGIPAVAGSARSASSTPRPSSLGSLMSRKMMS